MSGSEVITAFVSDDVYDPQDDIATNFDLDTVTMADIAETRAELLRLTQRSLRARGLDSSFTVWRYGPIRADAVRDVTAVTLSESVARRGARRTGQEYHAYRCERSGVLVDVVAFWPRMSLDEEELLVRPGALTRID